MPPARPTFYGKKRAAIIEALKGLPAAPDEVALTQFQKVYRTR